MVTGGGGLFLMSEIPLFEPNTEAGRRGAGVGGSHVAAPTARRPTEGPYLLPLPLPVPLPVPLRYTLTPIRTLTFYPYPYPYPYP